MTRRSVLVTALCACCAGTAGADTPPPPVLTDARVRVEQTDQATRLDIDVPGRLVALAMPRNADASRSIALLVEPIEPSDPASSPAPQGESSPLPPCPAGADDASPLSVYRWDPDDDRVVRRIRDDVPHDAFGLVGADFDGDGSDEIVVAREDELVLLLPDGSERSIASRGLLPAAVDPRIRLPSGPDEPPPLVSLTLGRLRILGPALETLAEVDLPRSGRVIARGWEVATPLPVFVGRRVDGTLLYATPAEPHGKERLHSTLIELPPGGEPRVEDCWARLPGPEDLLEQRFLLVDDDPLLFVSTKPAGKLGLFDEKLLRLYPLKNDRSRLGLPARAAVGSRINLWQTAEPTIADVDGDGRGDLVVGYWKGLKDDRVVLDAYPRREDGSFATSPRTTAFDVARGDRSFLSFGHDLNGDGLADLLLLAADRLRIHAGIPSKLGKNVVDKRALEIPWEHGDTSDEEMVVEASTAGVATRTGPGVGWRPRVVDVDGDGRTEILAVDRNTIAMATSVRLLRIGRVGR